MPPYDEFGEYYRVFTAGAAGAAKPEPGWLSRVIVTATLTGTLTIYDNPTTAAGNVLFTIATPAAGAIYDIRIPATRGIWVVPGSAGTVNVVYD
jgi:hypothetical protein